MKYIKTYESAEDKPQIGDYIQIHYPDTQISTFNKEDVDFVNNNMGIVVDISNTIVYILYDVPPKLKKFFLEITQKFLI